MIATATATAVNITTVAIETANVIGTRCRRRRHGTAAAGCTAANCRHLLLLQLFVCFL